MRVYSPGTKLALGLGGLVIGVIVILGSVNMTPAKLGNLVNGSSNISTANTGTSINKPTNNTLYGITHIIIGENRHKYGEAWLSLQKGVNYLKVIVEGNVVYDNTVNLDKRTLYIGKFSFDGSKEMGLTMNFEVHGFMGAGYTIL